MRKKPLVTVQIESGRWYALTGYTHSVCCDCGLTEKLDYKLENGVIYEKAVRDDEMTKAERRKHRIKVTQGK